MLSPHSKWKGEKYKKKKKKRSFPTATKITFSVEHDRITYLSWYLCAAVTSFTNNK